MQKHPTVTRTLTALVMLTVLAVSFSAGRITRALFLVVLAWLAAGEMANALCRMGLHVTPWAARIESVLLMTLMFFRGTAVSLFSVLTLLVIGTLTVGLFKQKSFRDLAGTVFVCIYPTLFLLCIAYICIQSNSVWMPILLTALCSASLCDIAAYFIGRYFGKHKLCPSISPKKTVEGAVAGVVFGTLAAFLPWLCLRTFVEVPLYVYFLASFCCSVTGQLGDLCASRIKREAGIKDFSNILPGHGGILDRVDSYCFAFPTAIALFAFLL